MAEIGSEERPDLNRLLARFGRWDAIPQEVWDEYDRAMFEYRHSMHERHRIPTTTIAAGVWIVAVAQDYRRFSQYLDRHAQPLLVARGVWRALKTAENRARLEAWMKIYVRDRGESGGP